MSERCSKISIPGDNVRREKSQDKTGAISSTVRNMNKWIRAAVASLGLLGAAGQAGCAHTPKVVPHSEMQEQRQVCVAWAVIETENSLIPFMAPELEKYLTHEYTNLNVRDLNMVWRFSRGCLGCRIIDQDLPPLKGYIHKNLPFFTRNYCDDVIVMKIIADARESFDPGGPYDAIYLNAGSYVFNVQNEQEIVDSNGDYSNREKRNSNAPFEQLVEGLDLDDIVENSLEGYHPDQLRPLSSLHVEEALMEEIEKNRSNELGNIYLRNFPYAPGADKVRKILQDSEARYSQQVERLRLAGELRVRQEKLRQELRDGKNPHVQELRREFAIAREAESNGEYEKAAIHFGKAKQAIYLVGAAYRTADIPVPYDLDKLAFETKRGLAENEGRIGVRNPYVTGQDTSNYPGKGVEEGAKMLAAEAVAAAPIVGRAVSYIGENFNGQPGTPTEGTAPGNGEIEVITGATGYLSTPCTDDGSAVRLPKKNEPEKKCTTFGGPSCTIFDLSPGKYDVSALRSGGCTIKKAGPVEVTVEPNKHMRVDFSGNLK